MAKPRENWEDQWHFTGRKENIHPSTGSSLQIQRFLFLFLRESRLSGCRKFEPRGKESVAALYLFCVYRRAQVWRPFSGVFTVTRSPELPPQCRSSTEAQTSQMSHLNLKFWYSQQVPEGSVHLDFSFAQWINWADQRVLVSTVCWT